MHHTKVAGHKKSRLILGIASLLLTVLSAFGGDALAEPMDSPNSLSLESNAVVAPSATDPLWMQVQTCIEHAMWTNKLNMILDYSATQVCAYVSAPLDMDRLIGAGYTVLKDRDAARKPMAFLTLPSKIVSGIEDPQVTFFTSNKSSFSANYFADAWGMFLETVDVLYFRQHQKHLKATQEGMALNSLAARSLNQLHIHMSCLLPAVQTALAHAKIDTQWSSNPITLPPNSHSYYAISIPNLVQDNPFLVMQSEPHFKASSPGNQTLVVAGAPGGGYYLLLDYVSGQDKALGEELLDQSCDQ